MPLSEKQKKNLAEKYGTYKLNSATGRYVKVAEVKPVKTKAVVRATKKTVPSKALSPIKEEQVQRASPSPAKELAQEKSQEYVSLKIERQRLATELEDTQRRYESLSKSTVSKKETEKMINDMVSMNRRMKQLEDELTQARSEAEKAADLAITLDEELQGERKKKSMLASGHKYELKRVVSESKKEVSRCEQMHQKALVEMERLKKEVEKALKRDEVSRLNRHLNVVRAKIKELSKSLEVCSRDKQELQMRYERDLAASKQIVDNQEELSRTIAELQNNLSRVKFDRDDCNKKLTALKDARAAI